MRFELYDTSTGLDATNKSIRQGITEELESVAEKGRLNITSFFRESDQVYVFRDRGVEGIRIDCNEATDRTGYGTGEKIYYLQVQQGKKTYANVIYPENNTAIEDLIAGIALSLKHGQGVRILE